MTKRKGFPDEFQEALDAGSRRDYRTAIRILESLVARGFAEPSGARAGHPELYLYLARSWHAEKRYAKAVACAKTYVRMCPEDGSGWFFLGRSFLFDGAFDRAVTAVRRSLDLRPDSMDARLVLGTALLKNGKPAQARKVFEDALSMQPDNRKIRQGYLNALFVEAVKTYKRGETDLARQMLSFLIDNGVDGVVPRLYLGHALRDLGRFPEALDQYKAAQEFSPDDPSIAWYAVSICMDLGDMDSVSQLLGAIGVPESAAQISPKFVRLRIIKNLLDSSSWRRAALECRNYIKNFGEDSAVHALYGEAQRNLNNLKSSLNHFFLASKMDPDDPAPYYGLMLVYSGAGNWGALREILAGAEACGCDSGTVELYRILCAANLDSDAEALLPEVQEAVRKYGAIPCLLLALARTYLRIGLPDLASGWYKKVLDMDAVRKLSLQERTEAMSGLFDSCIAMDDDEALLSAYSMCIERWDVPHAVRREYIRLLAEREMWKQAADQTEILLRYEDDEVYLRQLAKYRRNAEEYRQAAINYRKILRTKPQDKCMLSNLVFCLDRMGERTAAVNLIHEANKVFTPDPDLLLIEGRLYFHAGKTEKCLEVLRRATDLFSEDPRAWEETAAIYRKKGVHDMAGVYEERARELRMKAEQAGTGGTEANSSPDCPPGSSSGGKEIHLLQSLFLDPAGKTSPPAGKSKAADTAVLSGNSDSGTRKTKAVSKPAAGTGESGRKRTAGRTTGKTSAAVKSAGTKNTKSAKSGAKKVPAARARPRSTGKKAAAGSR